MNRALVIVASAALVAAYFWGRAHASGVPASMPLYYSGYLTDSAGTPASDNHSFVVKLYSDSTTSTAACTFAMVAPVAAGRFRLQLDDSCATAVHENPDLFLELSVDSQPFPRSKLGAVPYALESANAQAVPFAGVSGITASTEWPGSISPDRIAPTATKGLVRTLDATGFSAFGGYIAVSAGTPSIAAWFGGSWYNSSAPVVRNSPGIFTVNFALGAFSPGPMCVASSGVGGVVASVNSASASNVQVVLMNGAGAFQDVAFFLFCYGR
jgi:hypothetical protein